jgi:dienelactone hydrolase
VPAGAQAGRQVAGDPAARDSVLRTVFEVRAPSGRLVPCALWRPGGKEARGLVLLGHGGGGHKLDASTEAAARLLATRHHLAAAALDGPVHGERRAEGDRSREAAQAAFRAAWRAGQHREEMVEDWSALLDDLLAGPLPEHSPVGYLGTSMGTAYGLPFLAQESRVVAAVLGLWGTDYPASEHLADAARAASAPTLFIQKWDDALFDRQGVLALFDAIGATDKRLHAYPGGHGPVDGEVLDAAADFLAARLAAP